MTERQRVHEMAFQAVDGKILPHGWWFCTDVNGDRWVCAPKGNHFVDAKIVDGDVDAAVKEATALL